MNLVVESFGALDLVKQGLGYLGIALAIGLCVYLMIEDKVR